MLAASRVCRWVNGSGLLFKGVPQVLRAHRRASAPGMPRVRAGSWRYIWWGSAAAVSLLAS